MAEINSDDQTVIQPKKRGRPRKTEEEKVKTKSTIYVQKYREKHGNYPETQKKAFQNWRLKIKQLTGSYPSPYNKIILRDLKEK